MPRKWDIIYSSRRLPWTIIQCVFVRFLFFLHNMLALSRAALVTEDPRYWYQGLMLVFVITELIYIIGRRRGVEHKWISTSLLLFICFDLMPLWVLELDRAERSDSINDVVYGIDNENFIFFLEQSFLLVMIIGRWLLPKGRLSRDKLSNLLLILLGKASDMTDFFSLFGEQNVRRNKTFMFSVLSVWTISVFQFPIAHTETKSKQIFIEVLHKNKLKLLIVRGINKCFMTEAWSIFVSLMMQELPYLICRSYAIGVCGILNNSIIFFLFKNSIVVTMYLYRLVSLYVESQIGDGEEKNEEIQTVHSTNVSLVSFDYMDRNTTDSVEYKISQDHQNSTRNISPISHITKANIKALRKQKLQNLNSHMINVDDASSVESSTILNDQRRNNKVYPEDNGSDRISRRRRSSL